MKMTKRLPARRTLVAGLVGLVVGLGIAGGAWWYLDHENTAQAATPTTISRTVAATVDTIKKTISTTGTLTPAVQQDVSFVASGNVTAVNVTAGQQVTAGQPLATVDTLTMQQTLASANLTLAKAQATLVSDQTVLSTAQDAQTAAADAGDDTSAADAKVATAQQQITVDQTSITSAQAAVDAAQTALNSATLLAPIDGIVSTVNVTVGQKITGTAASSSSAAGSSSTGSTGATGGTAGTGKAGASSGSSSASGAASSTSSTADFVIVSTNSWKVDVTVDDAQIGLISVGDQAQLAVTSSTDPLFGTISSIGLISTASGDTASYPVEVTVTGTPTGLHDGTSATVTLIYAQFSNVLTVPSAAVHTVNGQSVVYTMSGDQQVSTPVVVGESDGTSTEITSGLNEGDEVVVTITVPGGGTGGTGRTGGGTGTGTGTGRGGFTGTGGGAGGFGGGTGGFGGRTGGFGGGAAPGGAVPGGAPGAAPVGG